MEAQDGKMTVNWSNPGAYADVDKAYIADSTEGVVVDLY